MTKRIAVVGSRTITQYEDVANAITGSRHFKQPLDHFQWDTDAYVFVSGGADGVDSLAEYFADRYGFGKDIIKPDWNDWTKGHPALARNTEIVISADCVIAVWDGVSSGTRDSIDKALNNGIPVDVIIV